MPFEHCQLRPEYRLLLLCARDPAHAPAGQAVRELVAAVTDWGLVACAAKEHRLAPLLFYWLVRCAESEVPDAVLADLETHSRQRSMHMIRLVGHLKTVLTCLQAAGIPVIVLKGPILGQRLFGNMALRPSNDLDLLVREEDRDRTYALLQEQLGFDTDFHDLSRLSDKQRRHFLKHSHELSLGHSAWSLVLDLHWRTSRFELKQFSEWDMLYQRADRLTFAGVETVYFRDDDLLVYLAAHGARHGWLRLFWLNDLAALMRGGSVCDWARVLATADDHRQRRPLLMGLYLAGLLFEVDLPQVVQNALTADPSLSAQALKMVPILFPEPADTEAFPLHLPTWFGIRWISSLSDSRRRRFTTLAQFAFVPNERDWARLRLPDPLFALYYLLRPLRLLWQYGRGG